MFSGIGITELILILVIALIIFGPGKLPDVGRALGKSIREFKNAERGTEESISAQTVVQPESEDKTNHVQQVSNSGK